jgi:hypothetical protein
VVEAEVALLEVVEVGEEPAWPVDTSFRREVDRQARSMTRRRDWGMMKVSLRSDQLGKRREEGSSELSGPKGRGEGEKTDADGWGPLLMLDCGGIDDSEGEDGDGLLRKISVPVGMWVS